MPTQKRKIGDFGETLAVDYLEQNHYKILDRNFQKQWGEIDIIAEKNNIIIFVEVKTRIKTPNDFLPPEINVNFLKQQKLIRTAQTYLLNKNLSKADWQIDVIAIELNMETKKANLRHIKNAIWE